MSGGGAYLDHAATSGWRPASVADAMRGALEIGANPGRSGHRRSLAAVRVVAEARERVASFIGARDSATVAFTKNATESINVVLQGFLREGDRVAAGVFEHNAVMRPLRHMERTRRIEILDVPGGADAPVDVAALEGMLSRAAGSIRLVSLAWASNVTGRIVPVREAGEVCRRYGAFLLVDAAQSAGLLPIDVERDFVDALAVTGHKALHGPQGIGALWVRDPAAIEPMVRGGTGSRSDSEEHPEFAPDRFEAGTLNLPGIAGMDAGVRWVQEQGCVALLDRQRAMWSALRARLSGVPGLRVHGDGPVAEQLPIVSFTLDGRDPGEIARSLDARGICCRAGLQCAARAHATLGTRDSGGTIRWSLGPTMTLEEIELAVDALEAIAAEAP